MQHVEFFHKDHFQQHYHRTPPPADLAHFIDFFWETRFEELWSQYPQGFSDALFPNVGYTYLINLGTPFVMELENRKFEMKTDGFLPRHTCLECYHRAGNKIFGIKFRISPVLFIKKINFAEYREYIFPLSYLLDQAVLDSMKAARSFHDRTAIISAHYEAVLQQHPENMQAVNIVREILDTSFSKMPSTFPWKNGPHSTRYPRVPFNVISNTLQASAVKKLCRSCVSVKRRHMLPDRPILFITHYTGITTIAIFTNT
jgi:hypothetical protein